MSTAQKLRQEGCQEGLEEGSQRGVRIGKIQMLEEMLGAPVSGIDHLTALSVSHLQARFRALQQKYDARFKR